MRTLPFYCIWDEVIRSAGSHTIALTSNAFGLVDIGSIITAKDANGFYFVVASWNGQTTSITL